MINQTETVTEARAVITYVMPAPDTSSITATVAGGLVTITYAGSTATFPAEALPALAALVATVNVAVLPMEATEPEPTPEVPADPEPDPTPAP